MKREFLFMCPREMWKAIYLPPPPLIWFRPSCKPPPPLLELKLKFKVSDDHSRVSLEHNFIEHISTKLFFYFFTFFSNFFLRILGGGRTPGPPPPPKSATAINPRSFDQQGNITLLNLVITLSLCVIILDAFFIGLTYYDLHHINTRTPSGRWHRL